MAHAAMLVPVQLRSSTTLVFGCDMSSSEPLSAGISQHIAKLGVTASQS